MNTDNKPDPLAGYGSSRMDAAETQAKKPLPAGTFKDLEGRNISASTCQLYDYQSTTYQGRDAHLAQIRNQNGLVCATKIRFLPKHFTWEGSSKNTQMFGQHIGSGSHLIITEGEIDAMAVHEAYCARTQGVVAVSITSGANLSNIKNNLKYIKSFGRVTIFFDQDKVGQEWGAKAVELIGPKTRLVTGLGYKDAGEAWFALDGDAIRRSINNAGKVIPDGVVQAKDLLEAVLNPKEDRGLDTPWNGWNEATQGFKPGELWLIAGGTGIGKSLFTRSMALHLARKGTKVAYIGLEEAASVTLERMLSEQLGSKTYGKPFHLLSAEDRQQFKPQVQDAMKQFASNLLLLDKFGSEDLEAFVNTVQHYVLNEECRVVFLDHFSLLADGIALNVDQRRAIDKAIKDLKTLAMELKFTFVVVCHLSRAQGLAQSHEEGGEPKLSELRGSHSLAQIPDYIWMLARNPLDKENPNTTSCWLKKNRIKGEVGMKAQLKFEPRDCQFTELSATTPY